MIKKLIPLSLKLKISLLKFQIKSIEALSFDIPVKNQKRVFIFLAADYGNLGDIAITYAQHKFLRTMYPDFLVTEIPISKTNEGIAFVKKILHSSDIITTVGGGNMGDLYPAIELFRQMVIQNFPLNKIISFPQTVDFKNNPKGQKALKKAVKIYSKHKNLTLLAREKKSYSFFLQHFTQNKIIMTPDIVFTIDKTKPKVSRKGVVLCLRNDNEKKMTNNEEKRLYALLNKKFKNYKIKDTHIGGQHLSMLNKIKALHNIWDEFRASELVITDRLHGMVFCYITNTPAIVFLNNNHKIKSSFDWIKDTKYIHLIEDFSEEEIKKSIEILKTKIGASKKKNMISYYSELSKLTTL